jgi:hypothetical protein
MQRENKRFIAHPRNRALDAPSYVRNCSVMAFRDPAAFIRATGDVCQLSNLFTSLQNISLKKDVVEEQMSARKGKIIHRIGDAGRRTRHFSEQLAAFRKFGGRCSPFD